MIGSGLKKFAQEQGLKVGSGVAYGSLFGYAATLSEGSGYKQMILTTKFPDPEKLNWLQDQLNSKNLTREYRVQNITFAPDAVSIVFADNPGTMKKLKAFVEWFFTLLPETGASGVETCGECGGELVDSCWILVNGAAYHMHRGCADKVKRELEEEQVQQKEQRTGSYFMGFLGALGGSLVGAVVWAIVLYLGYLASLVGLLIGWLAEKGYNLCRGKQGKGKIAILIVAIIIGVLLGTFGPDVYTLAGMISDGEIPGAIFADIPLMISLLLVEDPEYRRIVISDVLMGLLFAGLGVFGLLRKASREVADVKVVELP
jgi:hypothetical protein